MIGRNEAVIGRNEGGGLLAGGQRACGEAGWLVEAWRDVSCGLADDFRRAAREVRARVVPDLTHVQPRL